MYGVQAAPKVPTDEKTHRALPDAYESLIELEHYINMTGWNNDGGS
jgi:hypothetical protein